MIILWVTLLKFYFNIELISFPFYDWVIHSTQSIVMYVVVAQFEDFPLLSIVNLPSYLLFVS